MKTYTPSVVLHPNAGQWPDLAPHIEAAKAKAAELTAGLSKEVMSSERAAIEKAAWAIHGSGYSTMIIARAV
jgi:hypothetical protein